MTNWSEFSKETIVLGEKSVLELTEEILKKDIYMENRVLRLVKNGTIKQADKPTKIELVHIRSTDLGFNDYARNEEIIVRARELGLELCPAEAVLVACLNTKDDELEEFNVQTEGADSIRFGMDPIELDNGKKARLQIKKYYSDRRFSLITEILKDTLLTADDSKWVFAMPAIRK